MDNDSKINKLIKARIDMSCKNMIFKTGNIYWSPIDIITVFILICMPLPLLATTLEAFFTKEEAANVFLYFSTGWVLCSCIIIKLTFGKLHKKNYIEAIKGEKINNELVNNHHLKMVASQKPLRC